MNFDEFMDRCYCKWYCMKNDIQDYEIDYLLEKADELGYDKLDLARRIAEAREEKETVINKGGRKKRSKEYYSYTPILRYDFKKLCSRNGWDIKNFKEIFSGVFQNNNKKYFYVEV